MKRFSIYISVLLLAFCQYVIANERYQTQVFDRTVKSLRMRYVDKSQPERAYLRLNSGDRLEISFDQLSHNAHQYAYTVVHCNYDWTVSNLMTSEYMQGFPTADITDYDYSINTQQNYTHYRFEFPNDDMIVTKSGNYAIEIYEDANRDKKVATVCFSVVDERVGVEVKVRGNTDIELSGRYQQLDIDILTKELKVMNADDIILIVQQNGRWDNEVINPKPTYIESNRLRYLNNRNLIFEGGNEYRHFDINSIYIMGNNVNKIIYDKQESEYHALLFIDEQRGEDSYMTEFDTNGQWVINAERSDDDDYEAEYMWVHFQLDAPKVYFDGAVYLTGDLTNNEFIPQNRLMYDDEQKVYYTALYLKQGGYDYQYILVPKNSLNEVGASGLCGGKLERIEGSHWQTQNEYRVFVYYRPFGARYDQLVGLTQISH